MDAEMDAVTFLEGISVDYPDITSLLDTPQLLALDMDPREPFKSTDVRIWLCVCVCKNHRITASQVNEKFVKMLEGFFMSQYAVHTAKAALQVSLMDPIKKGDDVDTEKQQLVIKTIKKV